MGGATRQAGIDDHDIDHFGSCLAHQLDEIVSGCRRSGDMDAVVVEQLGERDGVRRIGVPDGNSQHAVILAAGPRRPTDAGGSSAASAPALDDRLLNVADLEAWR